MTSTLNAVTTDNNRILRFAPESLSTEECDSVVELAMRVLQGRHFRGDCLDSPIATRQLLQLEIGEETSEHFGVLFVDTRHRLLSREVLFHGTIDGSSVYPRVVLQKALGVNAAAVVFYHNHPSGHTEPSKADRQITQRLKDALALVDIRVLDHIIVSFEGSLSFAEAGLI